MNRVIAALKKIRLGQILMAFLAGVLLFVSTACSNAGNDAGVQATNRRQDVPSGLQPNPAVPGKENPRPEVPEDAGTSRFKGGSMNEFSDIDPRAGQDEAAAADKAKALIENAERNVIDETGNVGETTKRILDKKGENVKDTGRNLRGSAAGASEQAQGTARNLRQSTREATENVGQSTRETTRDLTKSASRATEDIKDTTQDTARGVTKGASRATENAQENTKAAGQNVIEKAQQAIDNAGDFLQGKTN